MTIAGAITVLVTRAVRGDGWGDFVGVAAYSIGWALLTFGALYLLSKKYEDWQWDRPDHDLTKIYKEDLKDGPEDT